VVFLENELSMAARSMCRIDDFVLPIGKARVVREGKDVTIVSYSIGVGLRSSGRKARRRRHRGRSDRLAHAAPARQGNRAGQPRQDQPHGRGRGRLPDLLGRLEIIAIAMEEGFDSLDAPVLRVCNEDVPMPYAANLEKAALIDAGKIVAAVKKVCYRWRLRRSGCRI
jgi:pyruvate dehydrogenase E1 component beta subunit